MLTSGNIQVRQTVAFYPRAIEKRRLTPYILEDEPQGRAERESVMVLEPVTFVVDGGSRDHVRPDSPRRIDNIKSRHPQSTQIGTNYREALTTAATNCPETAT